MHYFLLENARDERLLRLFHYVELQLEIEFKKRFLRDKMGLNNTKI